MRMQVDPHRLLCDHNPCLLTQVIGKQLGVWRMTGTLPVVIASALVVFVIENIRRPIIPGIAGTEPSALGFQLLFGTALILCLLGMLCIRFIRGVISKPHKE